jgi:hypothetical protein
MYCRTEKHSMVSKLLYGLCPYNIVLARPAFIVFSLLFSISVLTTYEQAYYAFQKRSNALTTIGTARQGEVSVLAVNDPVNRGNRQTIIVDVIDSESKKCIAGVNINGAVTYASRLPIYEFNGKTDDSGHFSYSWTIDKDAEPGIFIAVISATSERYSLRLVDSTTFEVI